MNLRRLLVILAVYLCPALALADKYDSPILNTLASTCDRILTEGATPTPVPGKWEGKTIIFDTNVIFNDPNAIYKYAGATIVIPGAVLEEIDNNKSDAKLGYAARRFSRMVDEMLKNNGNLKNGVRLSNGTLFKVDSRNMTALLAETSYDPAKYDNMIVALALSYTYEVPGWGNVILISDDVNTRIKAAGELVSAIPFEYEWIAPRETNKREPYVTYTISREALEAFQQTGFMEKPAELDMRINEFVMLKAEGVADSVDTMARFTFARESDAKPAAGEARKTGLNKLRDVSEFPFPPKNIEQHMALDILFDSSVELVVLESPAGTGKTFLSLLAGTQQSAGSSARYKSTLITRTLVQIGKENLGAYPGSKEEKLAHWYEGFSDAMASLKAKLIGRKNPPASAQSVSAPNIDSQPRGNYPKTVKRYGRNQSSNRSQNGGESRGISTPEMVAFPHIRGRNFEEVFAIFDEAQNSSRHEMLSFGTRAAQGTKFVILGDASQIDTPYLNERNNGLAILVNLIRGNHLNNEDQSRVAVVHMTEGVRSPLAELFRKLFEKSVSND